MSAPRKLVSDVPGDGISFEQEMEQSLEKAALVSGANQPIYPFTVCSKLIPSPGRTSFNFFKMSKNHDNIVIFPSKMML